MSLLVAVLLFRMEEERVALNTTSGYPTKERKRKRGKKRGAYPMMVISSLKILEGETLTRASLAYTP